MNIILIGFMGAGKTVVGQLLAKELSLNFLDTDELVEAAAGKKISQIFQLDGEETFRQLETEVLKTLQDYDNFVLSTGGGIILKEENRQLLKALGQILLLWAKPEVVYERIKNEKHRPLLQVPDPQAEVLKILTEREPIYHAVANQTVETSDKTPELVTKEITEWLRSKLT